MGKSKKTRKSFLGRVCALVFACYFAFVILGLQIEISQRKARLDELEQKIEQQFIENAELKRILANGTDEEYVERIAREKLGFAYPDERVLVDVSGSR